MEKKVAIKLEAGRGEFSAVGGLHMFEQVMAMLQLKRKTKDLMPERERRSKTSSYSKFKALVMGFISGADCLDDMEKLAMDKGFVGACDGRVNAATAYGDYLRSFDPWQIRRLNEEVLGETALKTRLALFPENRDFILDVDTSAHEQYGKKMEGVGYNYANLWSLESLEAFDQFGFQYWMDVREGGTNTTVGVAGAVRQIFRRLPRNMNRFMRADSGMCNNDVFTACHDLKVDFVIAMRENMYDPCLHTIRHWRKAKKIKFKDGRECEVGSTIYMKRKGREPLRIAAIRAKQPGQSLFGNVYDYRAWITNIGEHNISNEEIIEFYKGRGNAENFIRELKNGFDIHHFPCQKLAANKIYGVIAAFAYNLMRMFAWKLNPKKPHFSKMLRFRMVYLAGQVVRKARYTIIRLSNSQLKEVNGWLTVLTCQLSTA